MMKKKQENLSEKYCQQHVCKHIDDCMRSWKNMPRGRRFETHVFQPANGMKCEYYSDEILKIKEK